MEFTDLQKKEFLENLEDIKKFFYSNHEKDYKEQIKKRTVLYKTINDFIKKIEKLEGKDDN